MLGDHHLFRKGTPYDGSARLPLLLKGPRGGLVPAGQACHEVVELRDIMPTLLECAGLPVPEDVEGRSFLPLLRGEGQDWRPYLHGEHRLLGQSIQWITDGREKYVWMSGEGKQQLFDLAVDPQELHNLMPTPVGERRAQRWRAALIAELTGREEGYTDGQRLIPGRPARACLAHILPEGE